tara:strand:- start:2296 stop:2649 length:354 start_codon:yes stop_codon:yes gene_type:complete
VTVANVARRLVRGYAQLLRGIGRALLWLTVLGGLSAAVTIPVWWFATTAPGAFTAVTLVGVGAGAVWILAARGRPGRGLVLWGAVVVLAVVGTVFGAVWALVLAAVTAVSRIAYRMA